MSTSVPPQSREAETPHPEESVAVCSAKILVGAYLKGATPESNVENVRLFLKTVLPIMTKRLSQQTMEVDLGSSVRASALIEVLTESFRKPDCTQ